MLVECDVYLNVVNTVILAGIHVSSRSNTCVNRLPNMNPIWLLLSTRWLFVQLVTQPQLLELRWIVSC